MQYLPGCRPRVEAVKICSDTNSAQALFAAEESFEIWSITLAAGRVQGSMYLRILGFLYLVFLVFRFRRPRWFIGY